MYARQYNSEERFTIAEAREIILAEEREKNKNKKYFAIQKIIGIVSILIGIIYPIFSSGELGNGNISLIAIPIGILLLVSRKRILDL